MGLRRAAWLAGPLRCSTRGVSLPADKKKNSSFIDDATATVMVSPRRSTLYDTLHSKGMVVGEVNNGVSSMQRAIYFEDEGCEDRVKAEYFACRENAAIWDMSSFVKLKISGPDACAELENMCSLTIDRPVSEGRLVYCCLCNKDGGVEGDVTVLRTGEEEFYMVIGAELLRHVLQYLRSTIRPGAKVTVTDISDDVGVLCCAGPTSRAVLSTMAPDTDFSNEAFPFATAKRLTVDGVSVLALRVCFMGDLGWELHTDMENLPILYDALTAAAEPYGVKDAGYACLANLRTEKMFLHWGKNMRVGVEVTADQTPLELGFPVKKTPFIASEALDAQRGNISRRLITIAPKDATELRFKGHETLLRDGKEVGIVCTTAYSYNLERPVAIGWIENKEGPAPWKWVLDSDAHHEVRMEDGTLVACYVSKKAAFDSEGVRMRS
eukprot:TRINITY_DN395_c0_g2_i1.p1 TRINITY_DN395_c0_g2~~TRINITY_DN395_c0_g2_i1.p1  ORF type:complete len:438 (+),score=149.93 TRINITY_DN395_c0_g2_i1:66-1379(+)